LIMMGFVAVACHWQPFSIGTSFCGQPQLQKNEEMNR